MRGGALETVNDGETGLFFAEQNEAALADAVRRSGGINFDPARARANALRFDRALFKEKLKKYMENAVSDNDK